MKARRSSTRCVELPARGGGERDRRARRRRSPRSCGRTPGATATRRSGTRELGPLDLHHWVNDGADGGVLLRRRARDQARAGRRASCATGARRRCRRSPRSAASCCRSRSSSLLTAGGEGARGLGDPGGDRHRVRGRRARAARRPRVRRRAAVPAQRRDRRRHHRDHDHRDLLRAASWRSGWLARGRSCSSSRSGSRRLGCESGRMCRSAIALWFAVHESGVHATIAGVVLGLLMPGARSASVPSTRCIPYSAFVVVPLFALANAGVDFGGGVLGDAVGSTLTLAVFAGLVVGKLVGRRGRRAAGAARGAGACCRRACTRGELVGLGGARRHRLHRLAVHRRARVHRRDARQRGQGRDLRRLDRQRRARRRAARAPRGSVGSAEPVRITVLGKSPAWQDADGACSGYLVQGGGQTVLLDCGPGVFAKLRRHVDYADVDAVVITPPARRSHPRSRARSRPGLRYGPRTRRAPRLYRAAGRAGGVRGHVARRRHDRRAHRARLRRDDLRPGRRR